MYIFHLPTKFFQGWYTLGYKDLDNLYHFTVVRAALTKNLDVRFSEMHNELVTAFEDALALKGHGKSSATTSLCRTDAPVTLAQNGQMSQR